MKRSEPLKRGKPPVRRTPLRRAPLRAARDTERSGIGRSRSRTADPTPSQRFDAWRNRNREAVRARSWRCESITPCAERGVHVHHPFGRLGEPWASSSLIGLNLCLDHHQRVTGQVGAGLDARIRDQLRMLALDRLTAYLAPRIHEVRVLAPDRIRTDPPRATYEWLIEIARSAGVWPPGWREE